MPALCDLVLPCRDEGPALRGLLPTIPDAFAVIVVDNGSTDDTAEVARSLGARVVREDRPGYGAAVHAGVLAATADHLAVMDGDGSFDPVDLLALLEEVRAGRADMATGRRRPVSRGVWPWHARVGNLAVLWYTGGWVQLPADWRQRHGASSLDSERLLSARSWTEGLMWPAIGAHPTGAKAPGFASWVGPPTLGDQS